MVEWIINNKEWLFSGVLVAIPLAILGYVFTVKKNKQSQTGGNNSINIQVGGNLKVGNTKDE